MAKKVDDVESQLAALRSAADQNDPAALQKLIEAALLRGVSPVAAYAAELVREQQIRVASEFLVAAYDRFLVDGENSDKGCRAKLPVIESLNWLEYEDPDFYLAAMKYVQMEPVWGSQVDAAGNLRGAAAFALIGCRMASPATTMIALADLLHDSERSARAAAAKAIGLMSSPASVPLLRFKVLTNDPDAEVMGECFRGLISNDSGSGVPFVAEYLSSHHDLAVEAATALGESRNENAVKIVLDATRKCSPELREAFYLSAALSKLPVAIDFLISQVSSNSQDACEAVRALAPVRFYSGIPERVAEAVEAADDSRVEAAFRDSFE